VILSVSHLRGLRKIKQKTILNKKLGISARVNEEKAELVNQLAIDNKDGLESQNSNQADSAADELGGLKDKDYNDFQYDEQLENDSNKTDMIDDSGMNVFGFNDDLNMDDRIIV
jgi:hypothetical protein